MIVLLLTETQDAILPVSTTGHSSATTWETHAGGETASDMGAFYVPVMYFEHRVATNVTIMTKGVRLRQQFSISNQLII